MRSLNVIAVSGAKLRPLPSPGRQGRRLIQYRSDDAELPHHLLYAPERAPSRCEAPVGGARRPVRPAATVQNGKRIAVNVSMVSEDVHGSPWAANLTKQR